MGPLLHASFCHINCATVKALGTPMRGGRQAKRPEVLLHIIIPHNTQTFEANIPPWNTFLYSTHVKTRTTRPDFGLLKHLKRSFTPSHDFTGPLYLSLACVFHPWPEKSVLMITLEGPCDVCVVSQVEMDAFLASF